MSIEINKLEHTYNPQTPFEHQALKGITLDIPEGKVTAIIGQTGSGKSTLVQHLNGLIKPTAGTVDIAGYHIEAGTKLKDVKQLRKKVGLVFQFPEYQLFEETIERDIAFGPKNFGDTEEEANAKARSAIVEVGLDQSYLDRSPFELSGGQKRRVAIAGILVLDPSVLVLDEPAAGLDPQGAKEMMNLFKKINEEEKKTVLLVSHDMEHVMEYADEVIVLEDGKVKIQTDAKDFFNHPEWMEDIGINPPAVVRLKKELKNRGFEIPDEAKNLEEIARIVKGQVKASE